MRKTATNLAWCLGEDEAEEEQNEEAEERDEAMGLVPGVHQEEQEHDQEKAHVHSQAQHPLETVRVMMEVGGTREDDENKCWLKAQRYWRQVKI